MKIVFLSDMFPNALIFPAAPFMAERAKALSEVDPIVWTTPKGKQALMSY